jgi:hypothetical protein
MLLEVQNDSGRTINTPDQTYYFPTSGADAGSLLNAQSSGPGGVNTGHLQDPLPHPFKHVGPLANAGTVELSVHERDFRNKPVAHAPLDPGEEWNYLVQAGIVSLTFAQETTVRDTEELGVAVV